MHFPNMNTLQEKNANNYAKCHIQLDLLTLVIRIIS